MAGYVYGGALLYRPPLEPDIEPETKPSPFRPEKCGTNAGYHQHHRHKQKPCIGCHDAHKAYDAEYRAKKKAAGIKRKWK